MNWKCGTNKVFGTEEEAISYAKAMNAMGIPCGWRKTNEVVTHIHLGEGKTEAVDVNWVTFNRVFATEEEAMSWHKYLSRYEGILSVPYATDNPVTHRYMGNGICKEV